MGPSPPPPRPGSPPATLLPLDAPPFPGETRTVELAEAWIEAHAAPGAPALVAVPASGGPPAAGVEVHLDGLLRLPRGGLRATLRGLRRVALSAVSRTGGRAHATLGPLEAAAGPRAEALLAEGLELLGALEARGGPGLRAGAGGPGLREFVALNARDAGDLVDLAAPRLALPASERAALLSEPDPVRRLEHFDALLARELEEDARIAARADERARQGYLREKIAVLRAELGEESPRAREANALGEAIAAAPLPPLVRERAERELARFRRSALGSVESSQVRNALEWMLELPWDAGAGDPDAEPDPEEFERVATALDRSHTGLSEVKERVREFLAVGQLRRSGHGTALCFLGPPGTGKSSMGRAVARALGREFVHIAVGSITHESELRGVPALQEGAGPGVILEGIRRAGTPNPVVLLDEIDQLELGGSGTAGGPLLDVLDPEANGAFLDLYLGAPYDLSQCIFLATANDLSGVSEALVDRLEVIPYFGYTESEKLAIARTHLLPEVRAAAGLARGQFTISPAALRTIVRGYTEEAGVRMLRRHLYALARKAAVSVVRGERRVSVRKGDLLHLLGPSITEHEHSRSRPAVGVSTGLAWTSAGGALLPIEAVSTPGSGRVTLTGQVGEIMRESVQTCLTYVRTLFGDLGIEPDALDTLDLHLHFPAGAVPKEGPSAGIPVALAILSLLTRTPLRHDVAMTGETSLHGEVLPVGGLREKLLAAMRAGLKDVVLPARNAEEVERLPEEIRGALTLHLVGHVRDVFGLALVPGGAGRGPRRLPGSGAGRHVARRARRNRGARKRNPGSD